MEESTATATAASTVRRVFDCCLFNGEMDVLAIRFHELNAVVDHFVIVESTLTFSGLPQEISFNPCHPSIAPFAAKVRHIILADMPETSDPWCGRRGSVMLCCGACRMRRRRTCWSCRM